MTQALGVSAQAAAFQFESASGQDPASSGELDEMKFRAVRDPLSRSKLVSVFGTCACAWVCMQHARVYMQLRHLPLHNRMPRCTGACLGLPEFVLSEIAGPGVLITSQRCAGHLCNDHILGSLSFV